MSLLSTLSCFPPSKRLSFEAYSDHLPLEILLSLPLRERNFIESADLTFSPLPSPLPHRTLPGSSRSSLKSLPQLSLPSSPTRSTPPPFYTTTDEVQNSLDHANTHVNYIDFLHPEILVEIASYLLDDGDTSSSKSTFVLASSLGDGDPSSSRTNASGEDFISTNRWERSFRGRSRSTRTGLPSGSSRSVAPLLRNGLRSPDCSVERSRRSRR